MPIQEMMVHLYSSSRNGKIELQKEWTKELSFRFPSNVKEGHSRHFAALDVTPQWLHLGRCNFGISVMDIRSTEDAVADGHRYTLKGCHIRSVHGALWNLFGKEKEETNFIQTISNTPMNNNQLFGMSSIIELYVNKEGM